MQEKTEPPLNCAECIIGRASIYRPTLLKEPGTITASRKEIVALPAERTIFRVGEIPEYVYAIHSGWAYQAIELSGSRRQINAFLIPGDIVPVETVCLGETPLPYLVRSLTPVQLCKFPLAEFIKILERTEAQRKHTRDVLHENFAAMNRRMADIGRRNATGRLAQLILEIHDRLTARGLADKEGFEFPARQDDIADALGLTSVHVSRTLVDLRKRGLIDFRRNRFQILDLKSFRQIASDE
jgi:CRP/FNR family transcriptional regulator, anaerobic regulatory protein